MHSSRYPRIGLREQTPAADPIIITDIEINPLFIRRLVFLTTPFDPSARVAFVHLVKLVGLGELFIP